MKGKNTQERESVLGLWVKSVWKTLKANPMTFKFAEMLHDTGISGKVNDRLEEIQSRKLREHPSPQMQAESRFFKQNQQRVEKMLASLADETSRTVWGG